MLFSTYTYSKKTAVFCGFCFLINEKIFVIPEKVKLKTTLWKGKTKMSDVKKMLFLVAGVVVGNWAYTKVISKIA